MLRPVRPSSVTRTPEQEPKGSTLPRKRREVEFDRIAASAAALITFLLLLLPIWRASFPPLNSPTFFEITFPRGIEGRCEPLLTTGLKADGDFLAVRYVSETTAVLLYDVWGVGGPTSQPFDLKPGSRRQVEIAMPTLAHVASYASHEKRPLKVVIDGRTILDGPVYFHRRKPNEVYFAQNPIGGTLVEPDFRGTLATKEGRPLHGGPEVYFGKVTRVLWLIRTRPVTLLGWIGAALLAGLTVGGLFPLRKKIPLPRRNRALSVTPFPLHATPPHRWFLVTAAVGTLAFATVLTQGTFRFIAPDEFGNFYDQQAHSFLGGKLSLPESAKNSESFIFEGRIYMYFGPTPAILRLPLAALDIATGRLSRVFMLGYFGALMAGVYALQIHFARIASRVRSWPSRHAVLLLTATVGMGTTLFYLSARTYVYHEAIFCGALFAIWSGYFSLRYRTEPDRKWWLAALVCGLLSVHARPPSGLFALGMAGCAALAVAFRRFLLRPDKVGFRWMVRNFRQPVAVGLLAVACVLSFNGLSYLKFRSFEGAPLKYHVQYQDGRLNGFDGKNFHLINFRFNFDTYMWRPDFAVRKNFPFFYVETPERLIYPGVRLDLFEPTLAMPYTMPALCWLSLVAVTFAAVVWHEIRSSLLVIAGAAAAMGLALFTAVAVSHRYTGDFCPALILFGAIGLQSLDLLSPGWRKITLMITTLLAATGIAITAAITLHYQGAVVWGIPDDVKARYESLRTTVDRVLGLGR